jgi:hypothetical protein
MEGGTMFTYDEIIEMKPEDFAKNWRNGSIQDASLKLIGAREMTEEDEAHLSTKAETP